MKKTALLSIPALLVASASVAGELTDALTKGDAYVDARYRLHVVETDGSTLEDAQASTLRTRVGYKTGSYKGLSAQVEVQNVSRIGGGYNDGVNGQTDTYQITDSDSTELNQAFLMYTGIKDTAFVLGRQAVNLDNGRFIGADEFRQNNTTHDAYVAVNNSIKDLTAIYGYVRKVNLGVGEDSSVSSLDTETHLVNLTYAGLPMGKLTGYGYFLNVEDVASISSATYGLRYTGDVALADNLAALYELEYATQNNYENNNSEYRHHYLHASAGVKMGDNSVKIGFEKLAGNGTTAFQTPLSSSTDFNGWSNVFANGGFHSTPGAGIHDTYVKAEMKAPMDVMVKAEAHYLESDEGSFEYGSDYGIEVSKDINDNFNAAVRLMHFDGAGASGYDYNATSIAASVSAKF